MSCAVHGSILPHRHLTFPVLHLGGGALFPSFVGGFDCLIWKRERPMYISLFGHKIKSVHEYFLLVLRATSMQGHKLFAGKADALNKFV
jgi:hypothetical protein